MKLTVHIPVTNFVIARDYVTGGYQLRPHSDQHSVVLCEEKCSAN